MGNIGSHQSNQHRYGHQPPPHHPQASQPEVIGNSYVYAIATPYPSQYRNPNPNSQYYPGYYPVRHVPVPFGHHYRGPDHDGMNLVNGQYPYGSNNPPPYVEHQKALTIRNDVNLRKKSLRVEPDEENPGKFLLVFTFDATAAGSITIIFFAKEGTDCNLTPMNESLLQHVTVSFQEGLGQKFRQPTGTGIDFSIFKEEELTDKGNIEFYPLAVKAEAYPLNNGGSEGKSARNSQITLAVFEKKDNGEFHVNVKSQILWVNGRRYELQEIYGIGNSVDDDSDRNEPGKECVICLSEPRDTTVLPCRHMCMCSGCAKVLRIQATRCPICRQPVERLLEIEVDRR